MDIRSFRPREVGTACSWPDAATRNIPVVAFTSGTSADANRLVKAGCIGFIPKPFEPGTLPELVADFLKVTAARDRRVTPRGSHPQP